MIISLDRLSRFKVPDESFNRVFRSIVSKYLINPKLSKSDLESIPAEDLSKYVELIWNSSVEKIFNVKKTRNINILRFLTDYSFKNIENDTKILISTKLNIVPVLNSIDYKSAPINLKFLIKSCLAKSIDEIIHISERNSLGFPVRKLIIVEGITEEILLPVFANKIGYNLDKERIFIMGAGGKSKSPSLYMKLKDKLKIPVLFLFDADAAEIADSLKNVILKKDKIILIPSGEFEDILPLSLIKRSINNEYDLAEPVVFNDLRQYDKMCTNLENIYRTKHLGEFKKSKFSQIIAKNIKYESDVSDKIKNIIQEACE